jgi:hypothetical protein
MNLVKVKKQVGSGQVAQIYINLDLVQQLEEKNGYVQIIFQGGGTIDVTHKLKELLKISRIH